MTNFKAGDNIYLKKDTCRYLKQGAKCYLQLKNDVLVAYPYSANDVRKDAEDSVCTCSYIWGLLEGEQPLPKPIVKPEWLKKVEFESKRGWIITNDSIIAPDNKRYTHKEFTDLYNDYRSVMRKLLSLKKNNEL